MTSCLDPNFARNFAERVWEDEILPAITEYIRIPNRSQAFDPRWRENGHMERAVLFIEAWCRKQPVQGLTVEVVRIGDLAPVILMEVPGEGPDTVLLYGHFDKQSEMTGWREGLSPWEPMREGDKLYGRGGADDGYSAFASLAALRLLQEQKLPHARCMILIEAGEESGSPDLPAYIDHLADRIGTPTLIVCLDSSCGNYDQLWSTTSLRGIIAGDLRVQNLVEGVHAGSAGGVVPSSFMILRQLLSRVENDANGAIRLEELHCPIPSHRRTEAEHAARVLGSEMLQRFSWFMGARPLYSDGVDALLRGTWFPSLTVIGVDGIPPLDSAGNVLRPHTTMRLSMRIPPRVDPHEAMTALKSLLEVMPPLGAKVTFEPCGKIWSGWDAPQTAPWLDAATNAASKAFFGKPAMAMGEGGTIPFMAMLGEKFPAAQFLITGLLGPGSNAHGPNESLHIPTGKKLTCCVAQVIAAHFAR